jgi:hypothetical protein
MRFLYTVERLSVTAPTLAEFEYKPTTSNIVYTFLSVSKHLTILFIKKYKHSLYKICTIRSIIDYMSL